MKLAKWVFLIAGTYGLLIIVPMYFMESSLNQDYPPPITHPEYFYGFIGVTLAWQVLFMLLARDPIKYRTMMLPCIIEKFSYGIAALVLFSHERVSFMVLSGGSVDLLFGVLFIVAYIRTKKPIPNSA